MSEKWESFSEVSVEVPSQETESFLETPENDHGDNAPLLPGAPAKTPKQMPTIFSLEFYRRCWDVTTNEVRLRVKSAVYPKQDFISGLHGKPDLYGPFWVAVTLCFSTAICGNLSNFIQNRGNSSFKYTPEFERVTSAASAIFGYAFIFPFVMSIVLHYSKIMMGFSAVELLTAYGYSLSVFIPISFLWTIPVDWIRWILVVVGAVVSGSVVAGPIWKGLKEVSQNKKIAYGIFGLAVAANVALAVGFKMYFFESPLVQIGPVAPVHPAEPVMSISDKAPVNPVEEEPKEPIADESQQESVQEEPIQDVPVVESKENLEVPIPDAQPVEEAANPEPENADSEVPNPVNSQPAAAAEPVEAENHEETEEEKHEEEVQEVLKELPRANLAENPVIPDNEQAEPPAQPDEPVAGVAAEDQKEEPAIVLPRVG